MPLYTFECDNCGQQATVQLTFAEHDKRARNIPHCRDAATHEIVGVYRQVISFHINLGMREHFSSQLNAPVSSSRQFNSELSRQQDEMSARMGFDVHYDTIDPNDKKAAGVTDAGLESQERAVHNAKADGHKSVFS